MASSRIIVQLRAMGVTAGQLGIKKMKLLETHPGVLLLGRLRNRPKVKSACNGDNCPRSFSLQCVARAGVALSRRRGCLLACVSCQYGRVALPALS